MTSRPDHTNQAPASAPPAKPAHAAMPPGPDGVTTAPAPSETDRRQPRAAGDEHESSSPHAAAWSFLLQGILALIIIAAATGLGHFLYQQKTAPARIENVAGPVPVEVRSVSPQDRPVIIREHATVSARSRLNLAPRVTGRVEWVHPRLEAGAVLPAGAEVVRIDTTDFRIAAAEAEARVRVTEARLNQLRTDEEAAEADLAAAAAALERTRAEAEVAVDQFKELYPDREPAPLVAMTPQLAEAEARRDAAETSLGAIASRREELRAQARQQRAALARAEVDLERTSLALPDHASQLASDRPRRADLYRVLSKTIAVGDRATAGQAVAEFYDIDRLRAVIPIRADELRWIGLPPAVPRERALTGALGPDAAAAQTGSPVTLSARGARDRTWEAVAVRTEGEIDPRTRLVNLVAEIISPGSPDDPRGLLVPGQFVEAAIRGREITDAFRVPRVALRGPEEDRVWVAASLDREAADEENGAESDTGSGADPGGDAGDENADSATHELVIRDIEVIRSGDEAVLVRGLEPGDEIVLTRLDAPASGLRLRIVRSEDDPGNETARLRAEYERLRAEADAARLELERHRAGGGSAGSPRTANAHTEGGDG